MTFKQNYYMYRFRLQKCPGCYLVLISIIGMTLLALIEMSRSGSLILFSFVGVMVCVAIICYFWRCMHE